MLLAHPDCSWLQMCLLRDRGGPQAEQQAAPRPHRPPLQLPLLLLSLLLLLLLLLELLQQAVTVKGMC